jgi:lysophospholipase L1-like esterase
MTSSGLKEDRMNSTVRRLFTFSLISFLLCGCQNRLAQEPEETAPPAEEPAPEPAETAAPTPEPEPTPFDISAVKWILIGDSLTDKTMAAQVSYYDFVQKDFQCEVVNCGRSSTGYMIAPDYETFYQRIDLIDFTDADVVTIFGSFNDLGRGFAFGTAEDEGTDTIGGCMNTTIEKIREKAPDIRIGIATPTPWNLGAGYDSIKDAVVYWGVSKEDCDHYVSLLMEVAARHDVPVLDLYHAGLFDPNSDTDRAQYFNENGIQDPGIHPNSMGHYLMAPLWKDFLLGLLGQKG